MRRQPSVRVRRIGGTTHSGMQKVRRAQPGFDGRILEALWYAQVSLQYFIPTNTFGIVCDLMFFVIQSLRAFRRPDPFGSGRLVVVHHRNKQRKKGMHAPIPIQVRMQLVRVCACLSVCVCSFVRLFVP